MSHPHSIKNVILPFVLFLIAGGAQATVSIDAEMVGVC